ncbi:hypothetical protein [Cohnella lubricantis]|uniref:Uncharacterized protein n=1 Tax=Cohnella lubricantis TaxID=2163172 RepID=A0A841TCR6_9BACL|nr:hypothetical protein [Cohnella lubricantis]MBB6677805.1 hypothetical protein [Cohnella lubricantis]MBP2120478.1 hypothetical protein [Cohnella lubricantis]
MIIINSNPSPQPENVYIEILKQLPWFKLTAPMVLVMPAMIYTGQWLSGLRKFNISKNLLELFPTDQALWTFLMSCMATLIVYLGLSIWHLGANIKKIK